MNKLLALTICLGLAGIATADARPDDKDEKREDREERKLEKAAAKFQRKQFRAGRGDDRFERAENVQPQVAAQTTVDSDANVAVNPEARRRRFTTIERRGPRNYSWSYDEARRHFRRGVRRDRNWYTSNYNRFALFGGGYYYFDRGYWYPAYGYDPAYSTYRFDEPIYGYNALEPRQVLVNVQRQLRRQGYYRGAIDGLIGPQTRAAIARFQRDNGLYVTRAVDGPTLAALGLT